MTAALELASQAPPEVASWRLSGCARIEGSPAARCALVIRADGTWYAQLSTFTFADTVDLYFEADAGGHFCGPAFVEHSRADTHPFAMQTTLTGTGPLLVVAPSSQPELPDAEILEAEVVD